jgi:site-specific recombinase XerD
MLRVSIIPNERVQARFKPLVLDVLVRITLMATPLITIFVRHNKDCKYRDDETSKRCRCLKHMRWSTNGTQYRKSTGTRSWTDAEEAKRKLEDHLCGKEPDPTGVSHSIKDAVKVFLQDKKVEGIKKGTQDTYQRDLKKFTAFFESRGVFEVTGVNRELLTAFCDTWDSGEGTSYTRYMRRARIRTFLRFCFEAQWLARVPGLPKITIESAPTSPLTSDEYTRLLKAAEQGNEPQKVAALIQLMRWSGLAVFDALTLKRTEIIHDAAKDIYSVVTSRQKTGADVSVPIPPAVADQIIALPNKKNTKYFFWSGNGNGQSYASSWAKKKIKPLFAVAGIPDVCHMKSHRLRDTFAVDLLKKGVPLEEVSKALGHKSIKTTEKHYAKWVKGRQDRLDKLVIATWQGDAGA